MLSLADSIVQKIDALGVSSNFLAKLFGCSNGQMAQLLNGSKVLSNDEGLRILDLVRKLEHLSELARPLPLAFRDEVVIRSLLTNLDDANLTIRVEEHSGGEINTPAPSPDDLVRSQVILAALKIMEETGESIEE